jgi:hypothetical protein
VGEGLGKIAELPFGMRIVFLGEKAEVVAQFQQHVPGSVGRYGRLAEKDFAFAETQGIGGAAFAEKSKTKSIEAVLLRLPQIVRMPFKPNAALISGNFWSALAPESGSPES